MSRHIQAPLLARHHAGYGLLEMVMVLVLALMGSGIVFTLYQYAARPASDANNAVSQLQIIKASIAGAPWLHVPGGYSAAQFDSMVYLKTSNLFPADMYATDNGYEYSAWAPPKSPWGGDMGIGVILNPVSTSTYCKKAGACYGISYNDAPPSECQRLVRAVADLFPDGILVGGTIHDNVINASTGKINTATLASKCGALQSAQTVDQQLVFLVH